MENLHSADMSRETFADWEIVWLGERDDTITEDLAHAARSALIYLVARKP